MDAFLDAIGGGTPIGPRVKHTFCDGQWTRTVIDRERTVVQPVTSPTDLDTAEEALRIADEILGRPGSL